MFDIGIVYLIVVLYYKELLGKATVYLTQGRMPTVYWFFRRHYCML